MTVIRTIAAYWVLVIVALEVFGKPFFFGRPRDPHNPKEWLINIILVAVPILIVAADALGWLG